MNGDLLVESKGLQDSTPEHQPRRWNSSTRPPSQILNEPPPGPDFRLANGFFLTDEVPLCVYYIEVSTSEPGARVCLEEFHVAADEIRTIKIVIMEKSYILPLGRPNPAIEVSEHGDTIFDAQNARA
jgi:hypothetical protein